MIYYFYSQSKFLRNEINFLKVQYFPSEPPLFILWQASVPVIVLKWYKTLDFMNCNDSLIQTCACLLSLTSSLKFPVRSMKYLHI